MRKLDDIMRDFRSDKSSDGHNYTRYYEFFFEPIREKDLTLLEIGVDRGGSVKGWAEYFPNSKIIGLDTEDCSEFQTEKITIIQGDQSDEELLLDIVKKNPIDIVIDDGSHLNSDMRKTFKTIYKKINPKGFYVVEDLHACYWSEKIKKYKDDGPTFVDDIVKRYVDVINARGKSDIASSTKALFNYAPFTREEMLTKSMHLYRSIVFFERF